MKPFFLVALILAILAFCTANAVQFQAFNYANGTAGGTRFDSQIGVCYTTQVMSTSSNFIWKTFNQKPADRKNYARVLLAIEPIDIGIAYASSNGIHVCACYIANYSGDVKTEFVGILYHEMTHVWQSTTMAPGGIIEGTHTFV
ncbi:Peptidase of plants and bacteria [Carex littledalei]|uniref:Peptidase of plants and bacteria n=1 Tax=Carex littledalei TaxID=544730 RepID=A0A833V7V7_9POAL|nr:Peptidase of plants and bacteria [Carex littledalei]